jgi:hypothetical protein
VEQLTKSKDYMKSKLEECELKEMEMITKINKSSDLVKHLEMEKNQVFKINILFNKTYVFELLYNFF